MDERLVEIKKVLEGIVGLVESLPEDTTPERIKENRVKYGCYRNLMTRLEVLSEGFPLVKPKVKLLTDLFKHYYHYFDAGYRSPVGIDEIVGILRDYLNKGIEKINEVG